MAPKQAQQLEDVPWLPHGATPSADRLERPHLLSYRTLMADKEASMTDEEIRELESLTEPGRANLAGFATARAAPLPRRDAAILHALQALGVTAHHTATLDTLREFARAREAVGVLYDEFGDALGAFLNQPLADYSGKSVADLVAEHGVRALEAVRSDIEYPVPA